MPLRKILMLGAPTESAAAEKMKPGIRNSVKAD